MIKVVFTLLSENITDDKLSGISDYLLDTAKLLGEIKCCAALDEIVCVRPGCDCQNDTKLVDRKEDFIVVQFEDDSECLQRVQTFEGVREDGKYESH